jgi:catechol 2,3-dioxygenase
MMPEQPKKENVFMNLAARDEPPIGKTIKIPVLHHVNLKTIRMSEMIEWYGKVIGSRKQFQNEVMGFITNDQVPGRIALLTSPKLSDDPDRTRHTGIHHTAFEYPCVDDLLDTWVRLKDEGIEPHMCLDHGFVISYYYVDPDGNSVELQADWSNDCATSCAFMETSPVFASNPVGRFVDPAKMVEARKSGTGIADLHRRAYEDGEFEPAVKPDMRMAT